MGTTTGSRVRILHISDLHERGPREKEPWRRRRVLGEAWERNLDALLADGGVDLVCFTGDVADWGLEKEYAKATAFFEALLAKLGLAKDRLFVVPGNHDIARKVEEDAWKELRKALEKGADRQGISRWMSGIAEAPLGVDGGWRERILARQAAYRKWVREELGRPELDPASSPHGRLGYRVEVGGFGVPVHLIGLDTAWLAGDDADAGRLLLTEDQLMRLATREDGGPLDGLRVALMHHPFGDLADGSQVRALGADHLDVVLRGHLHRTGLETWSDPDRRLGDFAVGCLYEGHYANQWPNACQVLTIEACDGAAVAGESRFRAWSVSGGHWYDDNSLYRESKDGRLAWSIARAAKPRVTVGTTAAAGTRKAAMENPYDPWTPAVPPRFVGRVKLLRDLDEALEKRRSVALIGDYRIGKTSVLKTWELRLRAGGRAVRWASGEEDSGRSPGSFVSAVTGLDAPDDPDGAANVLDKWARGIAPEGLPPVILVDEAPAILERFDDRFFVRVRGMMGRKALVLVLASVWELDRVYEQRGKTSPWNNLVSEDWIGLLEPDAAERLVEWASGLLSTDEEGILRVWAGRHPFYLQMLGEILVEARREGDALEGAIERFQGKSAPHLRSAWVRLSEKEREAMIACVNAGAVLLGRGFRRLRDRGLVVDGGQTFGEVLSAWVREMV